MNSTLEKIYYRSPVFFQNLAVSALGFKLARERFDKPGKARLQALMETSKFNAAQMYEYQNNEFIKVARHAMETTKFYRNWALKNNLTSSDINSIDDINKFPIIEKSFLRENAQDFRSEDTRLERTQFCLHTSGTTGTPLTVYSDQVSRSNHYAFFSRLRLQYGLSHLDKRATLFGRIIMLAEQNKPPFWRYDSFQKNLLMSSYHLSTQNLLHYYNKLSLFKPQEIFAYPSSIFAIANYIVANKLQPITLKLIMTTAENLLPQQREVISKAFNAPIVNQYGCTEMAFFCSDFPDGTMKFHPEHGVVEIRNEKNEVSSFGEGELIATGFINYSMPVIRYAMGDRIKLGQNDMSGRQILESVAGRTDDVIYTLAGTPVGRLDPIFKGGSGIRYAQIIQTEDGNVLLKLVPDENYSNQRGESLKSELIKRLGRDTPVDVQIVDAINKEKNGKFRPVISHYKKNVAI